MATQPGALETGRSGGGGSSGSAPSTGATAEIALRRRLVNLLWWGLCGFGLCFVVAPVVWILGGVIAHGVAVWHWSALTATTQPTVNGKGMGVLNALEGTGVLMIGVAIIAGTIGIGCGIFLADIRPTGRLTTVLRTGSDVLSGIPSIVFGYVGYIALVVGLRWQFSTLAALLALSALVVPYIAKSTEIAIRNVPTSYREGGEALGMPGTLVLRRLVLRSAIPGIATGLIIALAISVGETAPLLYTAGFWNGPPKLALIHQQIGYLPYVVYSLYDDIQQSVRNLASEAGLVLLVLVLVLILHSRLVVRVSQKYSPTRAASGGGRRERRAQRAAQAASS